MWELHEDQLMFRVRWSEPDAGTYLYLPGFPNSDRGRAQADRLLADLAGSTPADFPVRDAMGAVDGSPAAQIRKPLPP